MGGPKSTWTRKSRDLNRLATEDAPGKAPREISEKSVVTATERNIFALSPSRRRGGRRDLASRQREVLGPPDLELRGRGADDPRRTGGAPEHPLGHAAEEHSLQARPPVRGHADEVGPVGLRAREDDRGRIPCRDLLLVLD